MSMTIADLMNELEYLAEIYGEEAEVRFASQPSWPFEYAIRDITAVDMGDEEDEEPAPPVVYLVEGNQLGYLPQAAKEAVGW